MYDRTQTRSDRGISLVLNDVSVPGRSQRTLSPFNTPSRASDWSARSTDLMRLVQDDKKQAFGELVSYAGPNISQWCNRAAYPDGRSLPAHLLDDAQVLTFWRIWKARSTYDHTKPFGPWAATIARRTAHDLMRRERKQRAARFSIDDDWVYYAVPEYEQRFPEFGPTFAELIAPVSREHQQILHLRFVRDLSYREIATQLGCPIGTVQSRLSRAIALLRQRIDPDLVVWMR